MPTTMKTVAYAFVLAAVLAVAWFAARPESPERAGAGDVALSDLMRDFGIVPVKGPAKPFTLQSLDGRTVALADFKGRPTLVYFWATW